MNRSEPMPNHGMHPRPDHGSSTGPGSPCLQLELLAVPRLRGTHSGMNALEALDKMNRLLGSDDGETVNTSMRLPVALRDAAAGLVIILPLSVAAAAAKKEGIKLHVSERFLRDKDGDPLGRPIPDYSHTACGTPPNHPDLKQVIAERWGDVTHPDISEVCDAYLNALSTTPRGRVWGSRVDIRAAYTRILLRPRDAPMLATLVAENHEEFGTLVAIPIVNQWGSQPANVTC